MYHLLFRDAYIYMLQQSERGMEYLKNAWILEQTEPDREELRKHFKWGEGNW